MANTLSNIEIIEFDALVKAAYQSAGKLLDGTTRMRNNVIGKTCEFKKIGSVECLPAGWLSTVVPQDPSWSDVTCTLGKCMAPVPLDDIQKLTTNIDSKSEIATVVGYAIGRRLDELKIEALVGSGTTQTIANGGTNLTYAKVCTVNEYFGAGAVPAGRRHIAISAAGEKKLMQSDEFISNDFVNKGAVSSGTIDGSFCMGMHWHVIPDMAATVATDGSDGGLPVAANVRSCFAWDEWALGVGVGEVRTEINYIPTSVSWLINGIVFAGSCAIDADGIVQVDILETA